MTEKYLVGRDTCNVCPVGCERRVKVDGKVNPVYGRPEYESIAAFGSLCCDDDLESLLCTNQLCNAYGIDVISNGATIAWLMECFEKGLVTADDTDGIDVRFGGAQTNPRLVEMIARREGFGDTLAVGSWPASQEIGRGTGEFVVHVKGQEMPMHDGRSRFGMALGFAVSPIGADHMHSGHDEAVGSEPAIGMLCYPYGYQGEPIPQDDISADKFRWLALCNTHLMHFNCIGWCAFHDDSVPRARDVIQAVTRWNIQSQELMKASERALTLPRAYNVREGFTVANDVLPPRMAEPIESTAIDGWRTDFEEFMRARSLYYGMMGWDEETGVPKEWKLHELGIGWVISLIDGT